MTTAPHITDLLDPELLGAMVEQRYVRAQQHPEAALTVYNYTSAAQYERVWNDVTLACRGLIVDSAGVVVARPFRKFFNYSEHVDGQLPSDEPVHVTDKLDGSLGILYPLGDRWAIATRGSFSSDQAAHGTKVWNERYATTFTPTPGWTYLFEIIYPENRIVVDYGDIDDLVLLGAVEIRTGRSIPLTEARAGWPGPVVTELEYHTLADALAAPQRENSEGVVIHFTASDQRVKFKSEEYMRLHRIVTGVSERRIWEALSSGDDLNAWLDAVPDECYAFVSTTRDALLAAHAARHSQFVEQYEAIHSALGEGSTRAQFAASVNQLPDRAERAAMFALLDGRTIDELVWNGLRPERHIPMFALSEDNN